MAPSFGRFRALRSGGWSLVIYSLEIERDDDGQPLFEIVEETENLGSDVVVSSTDPEEATCWIEHQLEEFEEG